MSKRPTPETDSQIKTFTSVSKLKKSFENITGTVSAVFARKLERERDEAREELEEYRSIAEKIGAKKAVSEKEKAIRERDEAQNDLEEEKKFHHRTHSELIQTQCRLMDVTQAIIDTLEENRHLADGDDCTLAKLKSVIPEWK